MKNIQVKFLLFVVMTLVITLFAQSVFGDILQTGITLDAPANDTYVNTNTPNFNITVANANESYDVELIINGTRYGLINVANGTSRNVTINQTLVNGNNFTWYFNVTNATGINSSRVRYISIDTTRPLISYEATGLNSFLNNTYWGSDSTFRLNVSYTEINFDNVTFNLLNSSNANINGTKYNASSERALNFTSLADGVYRLNVTVVDRANNTNTSEQRTFTIDTTKAVIIYASTGTNDLSNNTNWSQSEFRINLTYTETNFDNVTFNLLNSSTANINGSKYYGSGNRSINFTSLADGIYRFNVTVLDLANNSNTSNQLTFTIDTTRPLITYEATGLNGVANNTYWGSDSTFRVNVSYTETNFANVTFNLLNSSTANINGTRSNSNSDKALNFTSLADGVYRLNVTVVDTANNTNSSEQRTFTIDTTKPLISYEATGNHSLANNTNMSATILRINVSYTETNFDNVTFFLINITNGTPINMNSSVFFGSGNRSVNFSALSDGLYVFNVTVKDLANNSNYSEQRTIRVDTTFPALNHTTATVGNNSNLTVSTFIMNVSLTETNFANITFIVANASNGSQIVNSSTLVASSRLFMNYSLADGNYTVNVSVTDTANNRNMTRNQFVTIDTTIPSISSSVSPTNILPVEAVTLSCSVTDLIDPAVSPNLYIKKPGASSFSSVSAGSYTDTVGEGTYTFKCESTDYAGNTGSVEKTFSVGAGGSSGGSSSSSGSSTKSSAPAAEEEEEEIATEEEVVEEEAVSIDSSEVWNTEGSVQYTAVAEGEVYSFSFVSPLTSVEEEHSVSITSVDEEAGTVIITVASTPQEITLTIGESKEVDLDGDALMDLLVSLNGITNGLADISISQLGNWIEAVEVQTSVSEEVVEERSNLWVVWVIIGLVVAALLVLFFMKRKGKAEQQVLSSGKRYGK